MRNHDVRGDPIDEHVGIGISAAVDHDVVHVSSSVTLTGNACDAGSQARKIQDIPAQKRQIVYEVAVQTLAGDRILRG
ncbi:MAG: hypothetical protein U0Q18_30015 [Bryobacteraceae bacterium]